MFIKDTNNNLVFIKSKYIKAFPCGRRRSELVDLDNSESTISDRYYIPFDPEARLNTEANNRKHSGLNGYKQSYLRSWSADGNISLVLGGYLFDIASKYSSVKAFGEDIAKFWLKEGEPKPNKIFVNIKLANMKFFEGGGGAPAATTEILRDQSTAAEPLTCLDQPISAAADLQKADNYYFCGLSFSRESMEAEDKRVNDVTDWVSLQLLDYDNADWKIHEASRLPIIDHGDTKDSVKVPGDLQVVKNLHVGGDTLIGGSLTASDVIVKGPNGDMRAVTLEVAETTENKWQLKFYNAKISPRARE